MFRKNFGQGKLTDTRRFIYIPKGKLGFDSVFVATKKYPDGWIILFRFDKAVHNRHIEVELPEIMRSFT